LLLACRAKNMRGSLDDLLEAVQRGGEYLRAWLQSPDAERIRREVAQG
jgi:hypothetical protein